MKKKSLAGLLAGVFFVGIVDLASAAIIDLNARTTTTTNPVIIHFSAGTYDVTPIGVADGGAYNAWNAWGFVSLPSNGWLNKYSLSSSEFPAYTVGQGTPYATDLIALSNAVGTTFTLTSDGDVNFFITDNPYSDNIGGISLSITAVPEPNAILLVSSGIAALGVTRVSRRKKSATVR